MSNLCTLVIFLLLFASTVFSQIGPAPTPRSTPDPRRPTNPIREDNVGFDRLRSIETLTPQNAATRHPLLDPKRGIYRKPDKKEIEVLAVPERLVTENRKALSLSNTGIVRLNSNSNCVTDTFVVEAREDCIKFSMPGAGTAYSFRFENYRLPRLADIIVFDGVFKTGGVLQQVVMSNIGDVLIEDVSLTTNGLKFLVDLKPVQDSNEFIDREEQLTDGISSNGFTYAKGNPIKLNSTYALRSIAYRGKYLQSIEGIQYDELAFDKRRDTIVAFRVVDLDESGQITIVWRRLRDVEAPRLKIAN